MSEHIERLYAEYLAVELRHHAAPDGSTHRTVRMVERDLANAVAREGGSCIVHDGHIKIETFQVLIGGDPPRFYVKATSLTVGAHGYVRHDSIAVHRLRRWSRPKDLTMV